MGAEGLAVPAGQRTAEVRYQLIVRGTQGVGSTRSRWFREELQALVMTMGESGQDRLGDKIVTEAGQGTRGQGDYLCKYLKHHKLKQGKPIESDIESRVQPSRMRRCDPQVGRCLC